MKPPRQIVPHPTDPTLALVPLTRGYFAVISAVDVDEVGRFCWHAKTFRANPSAVYAYRTSATPPYSRALHAFVAERMGISGLADHVNRNGLDCRRSNLRGATAAQNSQNAVRRSGAKGVQWDRGKWSATVHANGVRHYLGRFASKDDAVSAVRAARRSLHGEFACFN